MKRLFLVLVVAACIVISTVLVPAANAAPVDPTPPPASAGQGVVASVTVGEALTWSNDGFDLTDGLLDFINNGFVSNAPIGKPILMFYRHGDEIDVVAFQSF